jgi:hypothetical protein
MRKRFSMTRMGLVAALNAAMVAGYIVVVLNGATDLMGSALLIGVILVAVQTPLLFAVSSALSRLLVMYLAMCTFLFVFGLVYAWDMPVGSGSPGAWQTILDGGFRILVVGHVFALPGFLLIAPANLLLLNRMHRRSQVARMGSP